MSAVIQVARSLFTPWSPWKSIDRTIWASTKRLYLTFLLPIAAIGPIFELILYLAAPFHSMLLPEQSLSSLVYIAARDTICGAAVAFCGSSLVQALAPRFGAVQDRLWSHQLGAIAITPSLLANAIGPFFLVWEEKIKFFAEIYSVFLLGSGIFIKLEVHQIRRAAAYTALVVFGTSCAATIGNIAIIFLQVWIWRLVHWR